MEAGSVDPTPDLDGLLQEDPAQLAIPVRTVGSVLVHQLPARRAQVATDVVPAAVWTPVLPDTPKRSYAVLISTDTDFRVSTTGTGLGMLWPTGVPYEIHHTQRVYVMSDDAAGTTLSHSSELWAD